MYDYKILCSYVVFCITPHPSAPVLHPRVAAVCGGTWNMFAYLQIIARCYNCQCYITGCRDSTGCHTEDGICCGRCGLARARRVRGAGPEVSSGFDPLISPTLERANMFQLTIAPSSVMSSAPADKLWAVSTQWAASQLSVCYPRCSPPPPQTTR